MMNLQLTFLLKQMRRIAADNLSCQVSVFREKQRKEDLIARRVR